MSAEAKENLTAWRRDSVGVLAYQTILAPQYLWQFFHREGLVERTGCSLAVLAGIVAGVYTVWEWRRKRQTVDAEVYDNPPACARLYLAELAHRGATTCIQAIAGLCFVLGVSLTWNADLGLGSVWLTGMYCLIFVYPMAQRLRNTRRRMDEVNALVAKVSEAATL
jgi:hypothetical protein